MENDEIFCKTHKKYAEGDVVFEMLFTCHHMISYLFLDISDFKTS